MKRRNLNKFKLLFVTFICWLAADSTSYHRLSSMEGNKIVNQWTIAFKNGEVIEDMSGFTQDIIVMHVGSRMFVNAILNNKERISFSFNTDELETGNYFLGGDEIYVSPSLINENYYAELFIEQTDKKWFGKLLLEKVDNTKGLTFSFIVNE